MGLVVEGLMITKSYIALPPISTLVREFRVPSALFAGFRGDLGGEGLPSEIA